VSSASSSISFSTMGSVGPIARLGAVGVGEAAADFSVEGELFFEPKK
jgi:hypothetical protein